MSKLSSISSTVCLACVAMLVMVFTFGVFNSPSMAEEAVKFNEKGEVIQPKNFEWREWIYVGTPVTPNSLNPPEAAFPEFHNVYIDPESFKHYKKTGEFRDGTVLIKELVSVGATQA